MRGKMWNRLFSTPWIGCFAVAGICIGLQLSPFGFIFIFLTFYPSVLFLNLGFVLLAIDGFRNRLPRWILIIPAIWFGGYYAAAFLSNDMATNLDRQLDENNANPIEWARSTPLLVTGGSGFASDLIQNYGLDEAFMRDSAGNEGTSRIRLVWSDCKPLAPGANCQQITDGGYGTGRPYRWARGLSTDYDKQEPSETPIQITVGPEVFEKGLVEGSTQVVSIIAPGHNPISLMAAGPRWTLAWIPMLEIGCHLKGGFGDRWDNGCSIEFVKRQKDSARRDPVAIVTKALGLRPLAIKDRFPTLKWRCADSLVVGHSPPPAAYCTYD